ncbi:MAG: 3-oxoacyl-[acyl-carrier protein] reductase [Actinomycetota bacterium]|jgi:3-oxoacyl-[acyl-carrier protein] reductase|nr:3-oxoacyl-[acyl-carrier protein] reductase [Actinomycetota bacterium]
MDLGLAGKAFLVTGGSRGLGRASAEALVAEGAHVVISARTPEAVERTAQELGCVGVAADLADPATPQRLVDAAVAAYGRLDGALLSVGGPPPGAALSLTDEQWRSAFDSVFLGAVRLARAVVDALPAEGGSLAFVLSTSVKAPLAGLAASNGLRPGLAMLAKTMADELGPQGVRVNGLMPGRVRTDRVRELDGDDPEVPKRIAAGIPLRRYGEPAEFGRVAAFLLSPAASYVTGAMVPVDGGAVRAL